MGENDFTGRMGEVVYLLAGGWGAAIIGGLDFKGPKNGSIECKYRSCCYGSSGPADG